MCVCKRGPQRHHFLQGSASLTSAAYFCSHHHPTAQEWYQFCDADGEEKVLFFPLSLSHPY